MDWRIETIAFEEFNMRIDVAAITDKGLIRNKNQDCYFCNGILSSSGCEKNRTLFKQTVFVRHFSEFSTEWGAIFTVNARRKFADWLQGIILLRIAAATPRLCWERSAKNRTIEFATKCVRL